MPRVPSAVTVVTVAGEGEMGGMAIRSFTSVSIDPLLISLNVPCEAQTHDLIVGAERFAVHLLSEEQAVLSNHFSALDHRGEEPFAAIPYRLDLHGTPILEDVLAVFYCARYAVYEAGVRTRAILRAQTADALEAIRGAICDDAKAFERDGVTEIPMPAVLASAAKP